MRECGICRSTSSRAYRSAKLPDALDSSIVRPTEQEFGRTAALSRCGECGFISADPAVAVALSRLYKHVIDVEYLDSSEARRLSFQRLIEKIWALRPHPGRLVDVGAGIGTLCEVAESCGFDTVGVEPGSWAVAEGRARGLTIIEGYFPDAVPAGLAADVICATDVVEHVPDPVAFLTGMRMHLRAGGLVVVVTPDISSLAARLLRGRWWGLRPGHVAYFTPSTMRRALRQAGLQLVKTSTFSRAFPIGYLLVRLVPSAHRVVSYRPLRRIMQAPIWLDLRDTRIYFAEAMGDRG